MNAAIEHQEMRAAAAAATGLSLFQEQRLRAKLRRTTPSEPWVDVQFRTVEETDGRGRTTVRRFHDPRPFPPGGPRTAMLRCPACGVWTPPNAIERGRCLDHADHTGWGPSPSAAGIRAMQYYHLRMEESTLEPEGETALKLEIRRHEERKRSKAAAPRRRKRSGATPLRAPTE